MRASFRFAVVASAAVFLQTPSFAGQVFFTNLVEPGDQYGPDSVGIGHTPAYLPGDTGQSFSATGFTPSATFKLTSFDIALGYVDTFPNPPGPNQAEVFLDSDAGGLPGSTIESWDLSNLPTDNCGPCPLTTVTSVGNPTLIAGNQYWIVATGGLQTFDNWSLTLMGSSFSPLASRSIKNGVDSGWVLISPPNTRQGALEVFGDAVPEPRTLSLMTFVLLAVFRWRSRVMKHCSKCLY